MTLLIQVVITICIAAVFDVILQSKVQQKSLGAAKVTSPLPYKFGGPLKGIAMVLYLIPLNVLIYTRPAGPNLLFWVCLLTFGAYCFLAAVLAFQRFRAAGDSEQAQIDQN